jgi:hypothetical protein
MASELRGEVHAIHVLSSTDPQLQLCNTLVQQLKTIKVGEIAFSIAKLLVLLRSEIQDTQSDVGHLRCNT